MDSILKALIGALFLFIFMLATSFIYAFYFNTKLYLHLKSQNYPRWRELTTIGKFGPGNSNPFKWLPYLYSSLDTEDIRVLRLKDNIRIGLRYSLLAMLAIFVTIMILSFLSNR